MVFVALILSFLLGLLNGAGACLLYGWHQAKKIQTTKDRQMEDLKKKMAEMDKKKESVKERLTKASDLAQTQMQLRAQAEMPSKNGLHSKWKNDLVLEIADLEHKKLEILRSIITDGFDPVITVQNGDGGKQEIPLSHYITQALQDLKQTGVQTSSTPPLLPDAPPDAPGQPKRVGKFFLYKGGKDDGTTH